MYRNLLQSRLLFTALVLGIVSGCASSIKKYDYPPSTQAADEILKFDEEMNAAIKQQTNVLSPEHFSEAQKNLIDAKKENQKGNPNTEILETLGYAKAHLDMANTAATQAEATIPEVAKARAAAIEAGAERLRPGALADADKSLKNTTSDFEGGKYAITVSKKSELEKRYLDLELSSIKAAYLAETLGLIEAAKKMKAEKLAKQTLASAESKYLVAERAIETDRHDTGKITRAADEARAEAKRLMKVTELANKANAGTPEAIALKIEAEQNVAEQARLSAEQKQSQLSATSDELNTARGRIKSQSEVLGAASAENQKLTEKLTKDQRFNQAFISAQASFTSDEAEVYRQGDNLLIRLKGMEFKSGQADLPGKSLPVLSKVKDVMDSMGTEKVVVEGHTDAIGSKAANEKLSDSRAKTVANYLVSLNAVTTEQVETKGYGFNKPITTNKTKEGRAQNRRVDLVISPTKMTE